MAVAVAAPIERQVRQEMFNAFGTRQVATIYTPTNDYWVGGIKNQVQRLKKLVDAPCFSSTF
jgi:hypothetical protein